jgi:hypothetical protein
VMPEDVLFTNDAGNFSGFLHRYWRYNHPHTQLAPANGAMGYGVPAAVAAKLAAPERCVVALAGDGGFLMTGQEIETAVRCGTPILVVVFRNGMHGTIAMHQAQEMGRTAGVEIGEVDLASYARSFGASGILERDPEDLAPALEEALASDSVALIDVVTDPRHHPPVSPPLRARPGSLARRWGRRSYSPGEGRPGARLSSCAVIEASTEPELAATWRIMIFMSLRCSLPLASPYICLKRPSSSSSSRDRELKPSTEAPSSPRSNSSSPEDIAQSSDRGEAALSPPDPSSDTSSSDSTPRALASLRNVPKWGRETLPLSIPETVVGLTPASSASRPCVHIRRPRMATSLLPTRPLSAPDILSLMPVLYHKSGKNCNKTRKNCLKPVYKL